MRRNLHLPVDRERPRRLRGRSAESACSARGPRGEGWRARWHVIDVHDVGAVIATAVSPDGSESPLAASDVPRTRRAAPTARRPCRRSRVAMGSDDRRAPSGRLVRVELCPVHIRLRAEHRPIRSYFSRTTRSESTSTRPHAAGATRGAELAARIKAYCNNVARARERFSSSDGCSFPIGHAPARRSRPSGAQFGARSSGEDFASTRAPTRPARIPRSVVSADDTVQSRQRSTVSTRRCETDSRARLAPSHAHPPLTAPPFRSQTMHVVDENTAIRSRTLP